MNGTVRSALVMINGQRRVFFEVPARGFGLDDLDALDAAIQHARRLLTSGDQPDAAPAPTVPEPCG